MRDCWMDAVECWCCHVSREIEQQLKHRGSRCYINWPCTEESRCIINWPCTEECRCIINWPCTEECRCIQSLFPDPCASLPYSVQVCCWPGPLSKSTVRVKKSRSLIVLVRAGCFPPLSPGILVCRVSAITCQQCVIRSHGNVVTVKIGPFRFAKVNGLRVHSVWGSEREIAGCFVMF